MTLEEKAYAYDQICEITNNETDMRSEKDLFIHALANGIYWKTGLSDRVHKAEPKSLRYFYRKRNGADDERGSFVLVIDSDLALGKNFGFNNYGYDWAVYQDDFK